jgi:3-keto-disaccharide hydrolase
MRPRLRPFRCAAAFSAASLALAAMIAVPSAQAPSQNAAAPAFFTPPPDDGPKIPEGFTPIFNGKDLNGWHVSKTNHHGTTPEYRVVQGVIVGTQNPRGKGGILLTDKKYKNYEVYIEVKPDWGCDSGLFLRSSEAGEAYQVTLDYLPGGGMGGIYGERLKGVTNANAPGAPNPATLTPEQRAEAARARGAAWQKAWKREAWNSVRARIEGDVPAIKVWINDQLVTDFKDTANHAADNATDGMIAIQMHFSDEKTPRWVDGGFWRWRVIAVKELP